MGNAAKVIHWNGTDTPDALRELPPGDYRLEAVEKETPDQLDDLPPETQARIRAGMADVAAGRTVPWAEVDEALGHRIAALRAR